MKKLILFLSVFLLFASSSFAVLNDSKVYYSLDDVDNDGSGNPQDLSGNGNHGTKSGATTGATGKLDESFYFDGSFDYVDTNYQIGSNTDFSISYWVKHDTTTDEVYHFTDVETNTNRDGLQVGIHDSDNKFRIVGFTSNSASVVSSIGSAFGTDWNHIVVTYDDSTSTLTIYQNGSSVGTLSWSRDSSDDTIRLGRQYRDNYGYKDMEGKIDEVGIWNRTLSSSEVSDLYNSSNGFNPYPTSTITIDNFSLINNSNYTTNDINLVVNLSVSGTSSDVDLYYYLDGNMYNAWNNSLNGYINLTNLSQGSHNISLYANNSETNVSSSIYNFDIDSIDPIITNSLPSTLNNLTIDFSNYISCNDTNLANCTISIPLEDEIINVTSYTFSYTGLHILNISACDTFSNCVQNISTLTIDLNLQEDFETNVTYSLINPSNVDDMRGVYTYDHNNVFVGGDDGELYRYSRETQVLTDLSSTDTGDWIGTTQINRIRGIDYERVYIVLDDGKFGHYNRTSNITTDLSSTDTGNWMGTTDINEILVIDEENIYLALDDGKFGYYNRTSNITTDLSSTDTGNWMGSSDDIRSIAGINNDQIFVGLQDGEFGIYNQSTNVLTDYTSNISSSWSTDNIDEMVYINSTRVVLGGGDNYGYYNPVSQSLSDFDSSYFGSGYIASMDYDSTNNCVYIGNSNRGFKRDCFSEGTVDLSSNFVNDWADSGTDMRDIYIYNSEGIYLATTNTDGLGKYIFEFNDSINVTDLIKVNIYDSEDLEIIEEKFNSNLVITKQYNRYTDYGYIYFTPQNYTSSLESVLTINNDNYLSQDYYFTYTGGLFNINLYLQSINDSNGELDVIIKTNYGYFIDSALVNLLMWDSDSQSFITADNCLTDNSGLCNFDIIFDSKLYKVSASKNGIETTSSSKVYTKNSTIYLYLDEEETYSPYTDIIANITETGTPETTNISIARLSWVDENSKVTSGCIKVYNVTGFSKTLVKSNCSNSSSGILYSNNIVNQEKGVSIEGYLYYDDSVIYIGTLSYKSEDDISESLEDYGLHLFMPIIFILISIATGIYFGNIYIGGILLILSNILSIVIFPSVISWEIGVSIIVITCFILGGAYRK